MARVDAARAQMRALNLTPNEARKHGIAIRLDGARRNASELLSLPDVDFSTLATIWPELGGFAPDAIEQLEIDAQYAGYLDRQEADIIAFRRDETLRLPADLDYRRYRRAFHRGAAEAGEYPPGNARPGGADRWRYACRTHAGSCPCPQSRGPRVQHPDFGPEEFARAAGVSRETLTRLKAYVGLLDDWNARHNLVSASSMADVWRRHVWDSAQLAQFIPAEAKSLVDLGSGAGFPGLVLAALRPETKVVLCESTAKKCRFLEAAAERMGLKVEVRNARIEDAKHEPFDVVTARACAPLERLLCLCTTFSGQSHHQPVPQGTIGRCRIDPSP